VKKQIVYKGIAALTLSLFVVSCDRVKDIASGIQEKVQSKIDSQDVAVSDVVESEGKQIIQDEARMVILDFYTDTSAPCKKLAPVLERLAETNAEKIKVIKVDANKESNWASELRVTGVPALFFYSMGERVYDMKGDRSESEIQAKIDSFANVEEGALQPIIRPASDAWLPPGVTKE